MTNTIPAHKVVGDTGKPGQVCYPETYKPASSWPFPVQIIDDRAQCKVALFGIDIDLTKMEEEAADARRLRMMYDNLFYNPIDRGV